MVYNILTTDEVLAHGLSYVDNRRQDRVFHSTLTRRFRSNFGSHPRVISQLWEDLQTQDLIESNTMKDFKMFIMTMWHLKGYATEEVIAGRFNIHEQTVRKWCRYYVQTISQIIDWKVVWPNDNEWKTTFIISVDCVNFGTNEPRHPVLHKMKKYFDRKGGKAGVTYEIALHLFENRIVWFNGPFPPNDGTDADIYMNHGLHDEVPEGKKVIADKIYTGRPKISLHNSLDTAEVRAFKARARARQESINSRLKAFGCLKQRFRHGLAKHEDYANTVCVVCIYQMENGSPLFNV